MLMTHNKPSNVHVLNPGTVQFEVILALHPLIPIPDFLTLIRPDVQKPKLTPEHKPSFECIKLENGKFWLTHTETYIHRLCKHNLIGKRYVDCF